MRELERATGIEPAWTAWKAVAKPLGEARRVLSHQGAPRSPMAAYLRETGPKPRRADVICYFRARQLPSDSPARKGDRLGPALFKLTARAATA